MEMRDGSRSLRAAPGAAARPSDAHASGALALLICLLGGQLACGPSERTVALQQLQAPTTSDRIAGVRTLGRIGKSDDDELWVGIEKLTRDPSVQVRIAAAESLQGAPLADARDPEERGALADDALSAELGDIDETVRIAAAKVLGGRCNPRAVAYLHGAYSRSGPPVRAQVAASLEKCGVHLEQLLAHAEETRRMHALEKLGSAIPAWKATAAHELGLLGRPDDVAKLVPMLDSPDGAIAAAAAEGMGLARATSAIPALQKLAGDDVPLIASAAIEALARFGVPALAGAEPQLVKQTLSDGDQSVLAASALVAVSSHDVLCATALTVKVAAAAALLAPGCPLAPFADALGALVKPGRKPAPLDDAASARAAVLLEAIAQAGQGAPAGAATPLSKKDALALGAICLATSGDVAVRCAEIALQLRAVDAGPALLAVAQREKLALDAARKVSSGVDARETSARELVEAAMRAPPADEAKIARLMAMVKARQEKNGETVKPDASARLKQLLTSQPEVRSGQPLLSASLRAALALNAKGADALAASLRTDADPGVSAAARGEPLAPEPVQPAIAADCFPAQPGSSSSMNGDGGTPDPAQRTEDERRAEVQTFVVRAPSKAAKPGCLAAQLALSTPPPANAIEAARATLWSDNGAERTAACELLVQVHDSESSTLRNSFAHDPERRVRDACNAPGESSSPAPR